MVSVVGEGVRSEGVMSEDVRSEGEDVRCDWLRVSALGVRGDVVELTN